MNIRSKVKVRVRVRVTGSSSWRELCLFTSIECSSSFTAFKSPSVLWRNYTSYFSWTVRADKQNKHLSRRGAASNTNEESSLWRRRNIRCRYSGRINRRTTSVTTGCNRTTSLWRHLKRHVAAMTPPAIDVRRAQWHQEVTQYRLTSQELKNFLSHFPKHTARLGRIPIYQLYLCSLICEWRQFIKTHAFGHYSLFIFFFGVFKGLDVPVSNSV